MSIERSIDVNYDLDTDYDFPIYASGQISKLKKAILAPAKSVAKHAVDYTTVQLVDKGLDGTGSTVICEWNNNSADSDAVDFVEFVALPITIDYSVARGSVVQLVKTDAAAAVDLGNSAISISERRT
jgi:hypothetical protein